MLTSDRFSAPTPEVQYLPALFRRIQQGEIGIPAFQRRFVWTEAQVIELFESVYRGFPIGSLLFWRVNQPLLKVDRSATTPFPKITERYPLSFVLDGLQRLSALYGVFHCPDRTAPGHFNVVFDLDNEQFRHFDPDDLPDRFISMASLFSPKDFLDAQRQLSAHSDSEALLDRAVNLHATFQQYMVPTVTIADRNVADVVAMFERINSTGTRLNAVDFMRAVTWSEDFDLNQELVSLRQKISEHGFQIPSQTLVKGMAVLLGKDPTPESMLTLRDLKAVELSNAVNSEDAAILRAIHFLRQQFCILSYEHVPYEGQFLALIKFFAGEQVPTQEQVAALARWFWAVSLNEELRGKPDHYVTRILSKVGQLMAGDHKALNRRLAIRGVDFLERRFIGKKALSAAVASMFAVSNARSLRTGDVIPIEEYMRSASASNYQSILSGDEVSNFTKARPLFDRAFANLVVVNRGERQSDEEPVRTLLATLEDRFGREEAEGICESQLIPWQAVKELGMKDYAPHFLLKRAFRMEQLARSLVMP